MQLQFRRLSLNCFLLVMVALVFVNTSVIAQAQEPGAQPPPRPNSLRLGSPSGDRTNASDSSELDDAPPRMDEIDLEILADEEGPEDEDESGLIIGSADTQLTSGSDSLAPIFIGASKEIVSETNPPVDLSVGLEMASRSLAHYSLLLPWMARSASDLFHIHRRDSQESGKQRSLLEPEDLNHPEADAEQPPTMVVGMDGEDSQDECGQENVARPTARLASEKIEKKPTPRTVRMPFEKQPIDAPDPARPVTSKSSLAPPKLTPELRNSEVVQRDPDSQREQEEPKLESNQRTNDRDLQGADAIHASKPGAHRREVKIEDSLGGRSVPPIVTRKGLEPALASRLQRTSACLEYYLENPESTSARSPWAVMHALIAFGGEYELVHGAGRVNAIGWMCHNGTCRTQRMFTPKGKGFTPNVGGGVQGHEGQFLAILAQSNVPLDYPIQIGNSKFTVEDLVRYEMASCKEKTELTFKLIGLSYYLDSNKQWRANDGKMWSIPKLIQEELAQPIVGSACGGTHRLMGFSFAVRQRQLQGQAINGQYARAAKFVKEYIAYTWQLQNPDGSFSTNWYEGRGNEPNDERKVQTSGHMLEWLMFTLPDEDLKQARVAKGIEFLLSKIYDQRDQKWPIGPRGHATRAIALYQARMNEIMSLPATESIKPNTANKNSPAPFRK